MILYHQVILKVDTCHTCLLYTSDFDHKVSPLLHKFNNRPWSTTTNTIAIHAVRELTKLAAEDSQGQQENLQKARTNRCANTCDQQWMWQTCWKVSVVATLQPACSSTVEKGRMDTTDQERCVKCACGIKT